MDAPDAEEAECEESGLVPWLASTEDEGAERVRSFQGRLMMGFVRRAE